MIECPSFALQFAIGYAAGALSVLVVIALCRDALYKKEIRNGQTDNRDNVLPAGRADA